MSMATLKARCVFHLKNPNPKPNLEDADDIDMQKRVPAREQIEIIPHNVVSLSQFKMCFFSGTSISFIHFHV